MIVWIAALLTAAAVGIAAYLAVTHRPAQAVVSDVVLQQRYRQQGASMTASAVGLADRMFSGVRREQVATRLSIAALSLRPAEWFVIRAVTALAFGALGIVFGGPLLAILGTVVGALVTTLWLRRRVNRARRRFEEGLADTLQLVAGSLRSGLSLAAALGVVGADAPEPIRSEIQRVLAKSRLGVALEDGLDEVADRMSSVDFQWVALAVRIQKEVGGNLAEIVTTTAETIRERAYLKRQVRTLSAEGRLSAYILIALPVVVGLAVFALQPGYLSPLFQTLPGLVMSVAATFGMVLGWLLMRRLIQVEV